MKFLFETHNDPDMITINVDEPLPDNMPDILPNDDDGRRESAEKQLLAAHTRGGVLINRTKGQEDWVKPVYRSILEIRGVVAVAMVNCYTVHVFKGTVFDWKPIVARLPGVIADSLNETVGEGDVDTTRCASCFGLDPLARVKSLNFADDSKVPVKQRIKGMLDRIISHASSMGAYVSCAIDHQESNTHLCGEHLPTEEKRDGNFGSVAASAAYDTWLAARKPSKKQKT